MEQLKHERLLVQPPQRRHVRMAKTSVGSLSELRQFGPRNFLRGDVQGQHSDAELDERVGPPFCGPIWWEGWDMFWDVKSAVWGEPGEDGLAAFR